MVKSRSIAGFWILLCLSLTSCTVPVMLSVQNVSTVAINFTLADEDKVLISFDLQPGEAKDVMEATSPVAAFGIDHRRALKAADSLVISELPTGEPIHVLDSAFIEDLAKEIEELNLRQQRGEVSWEVVSPLLCISRATVRVSERIIGEAGGCAAD